MLNEHHLRMFTGTEEYHRWSPFFQRVVLTDGAKYVAENGGEHGACWLMDAIASHQPTALKNPRLQDFQLWKLEVNPDKTAVLTCWEDSGPGQKPKITQKIEYTDFDRDSFECYCLPTEIGGAPYQVILLKSEY